MDRPKIFVVWWFGRFLRSALSIARFLMIPLSLSFSLDISVASESVRSAQTLESRAPSGFDALLQPQLTVVDIYYGNRKIGAAMAVFTLDSLQFEDPGKVAGLIPDLSDPKSVLDVLSLPLSTHSELVCTAGLPQNCGQMSPAIVGIIFDETKFQAEVFVNPIYLKPAKVGEARYLPTPSSHLTLVDSFGGAIAGSTQDGTLYSFQNRAIAGYGAARLSSDVSFSSGLGLQVETLVAAIDRPGIRYQAGLYWTPDLDFFGQRRIYGVGFGTQLDTRLDRDQIAGSTLTVYLAHRAQVDLLRDGRLMSSRFYDAGNQVLDTSSLPEGAYNLTLRIREPGGASKEEKRFFIKSRTLPPPKQLFYFLHAGVLADDRGSLSTRLDRPLLMAGVASRLSQEVVIDATTVADRHDVLAEVGTTYLTDFVNFRLAAVASPHNGYGLLLAATLQASPFFLSIDARKSWGPPPPTAPSAGFANNSFDPIDLTTQNLLAGNALQFVGSLTYVVGTAQIGVAGSFSNSPSSPQSFSFGPTVNWPVWSSESFALTLVANATRSNDSSQAYFGFRAQFNRGHSSLIGEGGAELLRDTGRAARTGATGSLTGVLTEPDVLSSDLTASAGIVRTLQRSTASLGGQIQGSYGSYYAAVDQDLAGSKAETRYSASFVTGGAATTADVSFGGQNTSECGVIVRIDGHAPNVSAEVIINGARSGRLSVGQSLPIFLSPYELYSIRLVPLDAPSAEFDTSEHQVSLFPGNVETLTWDVEPIIDVFGRAVDANGNPIANARVDGARGPRATDSQGYFQVELAAAAMLVMHPHDGADCAVKVDPIASTKGYLALGTQICRVRR